MKEINSIPFVISCVCNAEADRSGVVTVVRKPLVVVQFQTAWECLTGFGICCIDNHIFVLF